MRKSAQSTDRNIKREVTLHPILFLLFLVVLLGWTSDFPAWAQSGSQSLPPTTTPSIALANDIHSVREAYEAAANVPADPVKPVDQASVVGAVAPRAILKTFLATAYCLKGQTASGVVVRRGIIAADPRVLPLGSVVRIQAGKYSGIYTVMDTGGAIRGRRIDIYLPTRAEAYGFGAREIKVEVLREGWDPDGDTAKATPPSN